MSLITYIMGWTEINDNDENKDYNRKMLNDLKETMKHKDYDGWLVDMFCIPDDCGNKNPSYIMFGASLNHWVFSAWLEEFEIFMKKLKGFNAFIFCEESDGSDVYAIGYDIRKDNLIKDVIEFGESDDYNKIYGCHEREHFPVIFNILKQLASGKNVNARIISRNIYHRVLKYGEVLEKSDNDIYEFNKKDFDIIYEEETIKLVKKVKV